MTDEEYAQLKEDINSEDVLKRMQAAFILKMFPTKDTKYKVDADSINLFEVELTKIMNKELKDD